MGITGITKRHSSNGSHGHEAAHDLEHMRGEALAADAGGNMDALRNPTAHYADDEHMRHHHSRADDGFLHEDRQAHKGMNPVLAMLLAVPLYLWNFAPHAFRPEPGQSKVMWIPDVAVWAMLLVLELVGAMIKPFALIVRLFANMIARSSGAGGAGGIDPGHSRHRGTDRRGAFL